MFVCKDVKITETSFYDVQSDLEFATGCCVQKRDCVKGDNRNIHAGSLHDIFHIRLELEPAELIAGSLNFTEIFGLEEQQNAR